MKISNQEFVYLMMMEETGTKEMKLITEAIVKDIKAVINEFKGIFADDLLLGKRPIHKNIYLLEIENKEGTQPKFWPIYKMSFIELKEVRKQIDYLLSQDLIRPSRIY